MKVTYPQAVDADLVMHCREVLAEVRPGNPATVELEDGENPKALRRAFRAAAAGDIKIRLTSMKDQPGIIVVSVPDPNRPSRMHKPRRKAPEKGG